MFFVLRFGMNMYRLLHTDHQMSEAYIRIYFYIKYMRPKDEWHDE